MYVRNGMYPIKVVDYSWHYDFLPKNFMGGVDHPLHLRSLIIPRVLKTQSFNRAEEEFRVVPVEYDPKTVATVELQRSGYLTVQLFELDAPARMGIPLRTAYLPPGDHWEVALWSPDGNRVGTLTPKDLVT